MHSSANTRTQEFLCEICDRNRAYYSDPRGRGALKELQQTFPNPWLYVAELLQNAIDEGATRVKVQIESDESLVLEHDGNLFTEKDVESICMKGVSSKGAGTIGFMGIGFKSVFRSFEEVEVASVNGDSDCVFRSMLANATATDSESGLMLFCLLKIWQLFRRIRT